MSDEMIKCSACGKEYYNKAESCPHCGKVNVLNATKAGAKYMLVVVIVVIVIIGGFFLWIKSQF
jgi:uncharacterized OB-fold protein